MRYIESVFDKRVGKRYRGGIVDMRMHPFRKVAHVWGDSLEEMRYRKQLIVDMLNKDEDRRNKAVHAKEPAE